MNTEKLIAKGVERRFNGQEVLFKVDSLKEHFDGLQIFESDVLQINEIDYVKVGDVNFDTAKAKDEVVAEEVIEPTATEEIVNPITEETPTTASIEVTDPIVTPLEVVAPPVE